jgi:glycosyltransferase involved in cell wall biosynthesis
MSEYVQDFVSVVIPTRNRPELASKAVRSALVQTFTSLEVIVVVDGPDAVTVNELQQIEDPRLRVIVLPANLGPSGARNFGVKEAQGNWIAFLDDDDQWLPTKIARQLEVAHQSSYPCPIVSCRFFAQTANGELIWPKRLPHPSEPVSEYLFVRNSLFLGETFIATPTIFTKKELLVNTPFQENLHRHEDFDWLIKVSLNPDVGIEFVPEPLVIFNAIYTEKRKSLSNINNWKYSLDWINSVRDLVTPKAYSGFVTTVVSSQAVTDRNYQVFIPLLWQAIRFGQPRTLDILLYLAMWLIPKNLRQLLRFVLNKKVKKTAQ